MVEAVKTNSDKLVTFLTKQKTDYKGGGDFKDVMDQLIAAVKGKSDIDLSAVLEEPNIQTLFKDQNYFTLEQAKDVYSKFHFLKNGFRQPAWLSADNIQPAIDHPLDTAWEWGAKALTFVGDHPVGTVGLAAAYAGWKSMSKSPIMGTLVMLGGLALLGSAMGSGHKATEKDKDSSEDLTKLGRTVSPKDLDRAYGGEVSKTIDAAATR